jgi:hypothetical protein
MVIKIISALVALSAISGILFVLTRGTQQQRLKWAAFGGCAGMLLLIGALWVVVNLGGAQ